MKKVVMDVIKYLPRRIKSSIVGDMKRELINVILFQKSIVQMMLSNLNDLESQNIGFTGQRKQDVYAYVFFKGKREGFFIDIGAHDGKSLSNTYFFEQIGWNGICVEPQADICEILKQNRNCDIYNVAIGSETKDNVEFVKASGVSMLSGLNSEMTKAHKERIVREKGKIEIIKIKVLSFDEKLP